MKLTAYQRDVLKLLTADDNLETSTMMPYGFVATTQPVPLNPAALTVEAMQATLAMVKAIRAPTAFDKGADIHPDSWEYLKRTHFPYIDPAKIQPHGSIHGIPIHVRDDVPPGRFWPCECKRQEDLQ